MRKILNILKTKQYLKQREVYHRKRHSVTKTELCLMRIAQQKNAFSL